MPKRDRSQGSAPDRLQLHPRKFGEEHHMISLTINGAKRDLDVDPQMPLLWALRDSLNMTGTKCGCAGEVPRSA